MKCCQYTAGMLREPVAFQRLTRTPDGLGGWSETWQTIPGLPSRAMVRQLSGREEWRFSRINGEVQLMLVTRFSASLTLEDRVIVRGKAHNIRELRNVDFADRWLEIAVTGGVAT